MIRIMRIKNNGHMEVHSINPALIARITDSDESEGHSNSVIELTSGSLFYDMRTMSQLEELIERSE